MTDSFGPVSDLSLPEDADCLPLVSVVMPSLNQGTFIEQAIRSVLNQSYPRIELIVIDGNSTDNTLDILRRHDQHIAYWHSRPDHGQSHALNQGFERATGDIFAWLNADDLLLPNALHFAIDRFRDTPSIQVVFGDWLSIDVDGAMIERNYAFDMSRLHFLIEGFTCNSQAMFWRRELHRRFGALDESLHRTMDYDMILRFCELAPSGFVRLDKPLAAFRRHPDQKTTGIDSPLVADEHRRIADKHSAAWKYGVAGKLFRPLYRLRRAFWYQRRGGWSYMLSKAMTRGRVSG